MRRAARVAAVLCVLPIMGAFAMSHRRTTDTTECRPRSNAQPAMTLSQSLGLSSIRYERSTDLTLNYGAGSVSQQKLLVAFCNRPNVAFGVTTGDGQGMNFVLGGGSRADPAWAGVTVFGGEVQWRILEPGIHNVFVSTDFGRMSAAVHYLYSTPPSGAGARPTNLASSAMYGTLAFGYELSLFTYLHVDVLAGGRMQSALSTAGLEAEPFAGPIFGTKFAIGKF